MRNHSFRKEFSRRKKKTLIFFQEPFGFSGGQNLIDPLFAGDLRQPSFSESGDILHAEFILADDHESGFKGSKELFIRGV